METNFQKLLTTPAGDILAAFKSGENGLQSFYVQRLVKVDPITAKLSNLPGMEGNVTSFLQARELEGICSNFAGLALGALENISDYAMKNYGHLPGLSHLIAAAEELKNTAKQFGQLAELQERQVMSTSLGGLPTKPKADRGIA